MGNCLRHDSKVEWGGEDWTPALMTDDEKSAMKKGDHDRKDDYSTPSSKVREVKVKITKKQLEELLGKMNKVEQQGFSNEQVLGHLVKVSVHCETHHRSWRPRLKSIPEV